jgi:hypothetical protein
MQLGDAGPGAPGAGTAMRDQVALIHAAATMQGGISFAREATVGLRGAAREGEQPWQILAWDQP